MRITKAIIALAILIAGTHGLVAADQPDTRIQQDRTQWVRKCMDDFAAIKSGMTRAQVQKLFQMDGGVQGYETVRYLHPECPYFMVDVSFNVKRNEADQGRLVPTQEDKIVHVSKPYLEGPSRN